MERDDKDEEIIKESREIEEANNGVREIRKNLEERSDKIRKEALSHVLRLFGEAMRKGP